MDLVDELDQDGPVQNGPRRPHKLDYYSIPIFILELIILAALAFAAYIIHFEYKHKPLVSGFYCDDISLRHNYEENKSVLRHVRRADNELVALALLLCVPIVLIVFCELVNSMFGQVRFRKIRAICTCCKLHSITRRTFRFSGSYALGFFIVVISCNILADTSGMLKPYFGQHCQDAFRGCAKVNSRQTRALLDTAAVAQSDITAADASNVQPLSPPIASSSNPATSLSSLITSETRPGAVVTIQDQPTTSTDVQPPIQPAALVSGDQVNGMDPWHRQWIDLSEKDDVVKRTCHLEGNSNQERGYEQLTRSWPSFPAAIVCYTCLYIAIYLSYVGTARPFRIITSVLVMVLMLLATMFSTQLVKEHYNHWEDVAGGAALALGVTLFVLFVYLNQFRDTHYYERQKMFGKNSPEARAANMYNNANLDSFGQYNFDKHDDQDEHLANGDTGGSVSNDIAMRYFQIPRANYRGAPRPITSMNQR